MRRKKKERLEEQIKEEVLSGVRIVTYVLAGIAEHENEILK